MVIIVGSLLKVMVPHLTNVQNQLQNYLYLYLYRDSFSIWVLKGVIYGIGDTDGSDNLKSIEGYKPNDEVW